MTLPQGSPETAGLRRLELFGFLWGLAILYHQVFYRVALSSPLDAGLTVAAVAALLRPGSAAILGVLGGLHVLVVAQYLPAVFNHWYFSGLVSLALLLAAITAAGRSRRPGGPPADDSLLAAFAPAGRLCLLLLYFVSGFHKLNHDFLSPEVSCGSLMFHSLLGRLGMPAGGLSIGVAGIGVTLAVELGAPVLLAISRTRTVAVILALLFHLAMALAGYARFSAAAIALLILFLPAGSGVAWLSGRIRLGMAAVLLAGAVTGPWIASRLFLAAVLLATGAVLVVALRAMRLRADSGTGLRPMGGRVPMVAPALLLLSAVAPYLGLGTDRALAMYSNLRTEGGRSNHLLVPAGAQLFPYQRDLVVILESSLPQLRQAADRGSVLPYQELRAILSDPPAGAIPGPSLVYVRGGERHTIGDAARDTTLGLPVSALARKLLRFRAIEPAGRRACGV